MTFGGFLSHTSQSVGRTRGSHPEICRRDIVSYWTALHIFSTSGVYEMRFLVVVFLCYLNAIKIRSW